MTDSTRPAAPIDLGSAIGTRDAACLLRGRGGRVGVSTETARRYMGRGCRLPDGTRLVLRSVVWCQEVLTTRAWVEEFERARLDAALAAMRGAAGGGEVDGPVSHP